MKQIILVSRIHAYGVEEEFTKYSNDNTLDFLSLYTEGYVLIIVNGSKMRALTGNVPKAAKILEIANSQSLNKTCDTVIAYHNATNLDGALSSQFSEDGWLKITISRYSSASEKDKPLYDILNTIGGNAINGNKLSDTLLKSLWDFWNVDTTMEAKLNLLHGIVKGEVIHELPKALQTKSVNDYFEPLKGKKYDNQNEGTRESLKQLRDVVLGAK
jgi:hypothetical protein